VAEQQGTGSTAAKGQAYTAVVGANVGGDRYEPGDTIPAGRLNPATAKAWLDQGLVAKATTKKGDR